MSKMQVDFYVGNLDCEHDAAAIERGLRGAAGLVDLKVYPKAARVRLVYDQAQTSPPVLADKLQRLGFPPRRPGAAAAPRRLWRNPKVATSALSGLLLLVGWLAGLAGAPPFISTASYLVAIVTGGYFFGREAIEELVVDGRSASSC